MSCATRRGEHGGKQDGNATLASDTDQRLALAALIQDCSKDIEKRWLARVEAGLQDKRASSRELTNALPDYLLRLGDALRSSASTEAGLAAWSDLARERPPGG